LTESYLLIDAQAAYMWHGYERGIGYINRRYRRRQGGEIIHSSFRRIIAD